MHAPVRVAGFDLPMARAARRKVLPAELRPLLEECRAMFELLRRHALAPERLEHPQRSPPLLQSPTAADGTAGMRPWPWIS